MSQDKELLPCPFCGCSNLYLSSNGYQNCFVTCECGTEGPTCDTEAQASVKWNSRVAIAAQAGQAMAANAAYAPQNISEWVDANPEKSKLVVKEMYDRAMKRMLGQKELRWIL